jgi:hypothetical protein
MPLGRRGDWNLECQELGGEKIQSRSHTDITRLHITLQVCLAGIWFRQTDLNEDDIMIVIVGNELKDAAH